MQWYDDLLAEWVGPTLGKARTVVELGAAFGHMLWSLRQRFPGKLYRGGEYTESGIQVANLLYANHPDISVEHLNFLRQRLRRPRQGGRSRGGADQSGDRAIPDCRCIIDVLAKHRTKIAAVIHIEPAYDLQTPTTLLGQMRRRYIEINDYNRNLSAPQEPPGYPHRKN